MLKHKQSRITEKYFLLELSHVGVPTQRLNLCAWRTFRLRELGFLLRATNNYTSGKLRCFQSL